MHDFLLHVELMLDNVCFRIDFKVLLLVFKCLNDLGPSYLSGLLLPYRPPRTLRSSGTGLSSVPNVRTKIFGEALRPMPVEQPAGWPQGH